MRDREERTVGLHNASGLFYSDLEKPNRPPLTDILDMGNDLTKAGLRVVRGPDWSWGAQDAGEGHVGTVVAVRLGVADVLWDSGTSNQYRAGAEGKYDLRCLDNAQLGVVHKSVTCDECKTRGVRGIRWKCTDCYDFDLCSTCYFDNKHDINHAFLRFDTDTLSGVLVPKRAGSTKLQSRGIFTGAKVKRGKHWEWGDQDGGREKVGTVTEIRQWSSDGARDAARVTWPSGMTNNYRLGMGGKVDLSCAVASAGPCYYRDHLPVLGKKPDSTTSQAEFKDGDNVRVGLSADVVKAMQEGHGGWNDEMSKALGKVGRVVGLTAKRDLRVVVGDRTWTFNREVCSKVDPSTASANNSTNSIGRGGQGVLAVGDTVRTDLDVDILKVMQQGHGGWASGMEKVVGKLGKVHSVMDSGDVRVKYEDVRSPLVLHAGALTKVPGTPCQLKIGDKVAVNLDSDVLEAMQEGHGGWNDGMAKCIGRTGIVDRIFDDGDVKVRYDNASWVFNRAAVSKVDRISMGDFVRIVGDYETAKRLQNHHGGWVDDMKQALGKTGKVTSIDGDGDVQVLVAGRRWWFNPASCRAAADGEQEVNNTVDDDKQEEHSILDVFAEALLGALLENRQTSTSPDMLVQHAAQGNVEATRQVLSKHPECVDIKNSGKTALHVASHQGHDEIVKVLLDAGANLELQDEDGDTALGFAVFGNESEIAELLLSRGANANTLNNRGLSALQIAVNKGFQDVVSTLIANNCDVNVQDEAGDTPLHDVIIRANNQIADLIVAHPSVDLTIRNQRGFNVLHWAALKGNNHVTEVILQKARQLVDIRKEDGFSALHLAVFNKHLEVTETLLTKGQADIEVRNREQQSPLHLACAKGFKEGVELLVSKGASVDSKDKDGDTPLHVTLMIQTVATQLQGLLGLSDDGTTVAIARLLCRSGASLSMKNHKGKSCLDLVTNKPTRDLLISESQGPSSPGTPAPTTTAPTVPIPPVPSPQGTTAAKECLICSETPPEVIFEPCGHRISCSECCRKMKKCVICQTPISKKMVSVALDDAQRLGQSDEQLRNLRQQVGEMEDTLTCTICCERPKTTAFLCGHSTCSTCSDQLTECHICRTVITQRINLFM